MVRLFLFLCVCAVPLNAGPWSRGAGNSFVSLSYETPFKTPADTGYASLYIERGLDDVWTLGLDAGSDLRDTRFAFLFLKRPIQRADGPYKLSWEAAVGAAQLFNQSALTVRSGLSFGRGTRWFQRDGWATLDLYYTLAPEHAVWWSKAEVTAGLDLTDRTKLLLQATAEQTSFGGAFHSVGLAGAVRLRPGLHLLTGVIAKDHAASPVLKVGFWHEFSRRKSR
ncbi:hypothetical protein [Shimia sp. SDUM112013]|uniref:hypothetical protein n=1 Tax=Shimia sp. SDUM112013 TaxID=3136160 RepID=UPI0032EF454F